MPSVSDDVVVCPRGHASARVVRDGVQRSGGREKQRWRCVLLDGSYHRFLGAVSRTRSSTSTCLECENHVAPHQGPAAPAEFEYLVREIAGALVDVGRGQTYTDAAKRVRARANVGKTGQLREVVNGQTVSEWLADFVPVVAERYRPREWPAVLVLDSISFRWTDHLTGDSRSLYSILAAYGYDKAGKNGRLWKLEASPAEDAEAWAEFLRSLPGKPESIVSDQGPAIIAGINIRWGEWAAQHLVHYCEHHLSERGKATFTSDKLKPDDPARRLFRQALQSSEQWDAFEEEVKSRPQLIMTNRWVTTNGIHIRAQAHGRSRIPPVYSNGAVEQPLRDLRQNLQSRAFAFRNRARLNQLLELMRLANQRVDNAADYATDIRAHLDEHNGHPPRTYRAIYDTKTDESGTVLLNSLWSEPAQLAMIQARMDEAALKLRRS